MPAPKPNQRKPEPSKHSKKKIRQKPEPRKESFPPLDKHLVKNIDFFLDFLKKYGGFPGHFLPSLSTLASDKKRTPEQLHKEVKKILKSIPSGKQATASDFEAIRGSLHNYFVNGKPFFGYGTLAEYLKQHHKYKNYKTYSTPPPLTKAQQRFAEQKYNDALYLAHFFLKKNNISLSKDEFADAFHISLVNTARAFDAKKGFSFSTLFLDAFKKKIWNLWKRKKRRRSLNEIPLPPDEEFLAVQPREVKIEKHSLYPALKVLVELAKKPDTKINLTDIAILLAKMSGNTLADISSYFKVSRNAVHLRLKKVSFLLERALEDYHT